MPAVIIVISPLAALAAPPEIGASMYSRPWSARRFSSAIDQFGSTVEHITNTRARAHGCGAAIGAEQHLFGLLRVDDDRHDDVAGRGQLGR